MPWIRLTHFCAMTQPAVLPGVGINTHGRRNSSAIAWILPASRASFVSYLPFGRKPSWKFAFAFSTCMIPLKISRSSLRRGPGWFAQKRLDLRPLLIVEPKQMRFHRLASKSVDQPLESKHGVLILRHVPQKLPHFFDPDVL